MVRVAWDWPAGPLLAPHKRSPHGPMPPRCLPCGPRAARYPPTLLSVSLSHLWAHSRCSENRSWRGPKGGWRPDLPAGTQRYGRQPSPGLSLVPQAMQPRDPGRLLLKTPESPVQRAGSSSPQTGSLPLYLTLGGVSQAPRVPSPAAPPCPPHPQSCPAGSLQSSGTFGASKICWLLPPSTQPPAFNTCPP